MKVLPCFPCPHASSCCHFGTDLLSNEAEQIQKEFGIESVIQIGQEFRTSIKDGV